MHHFHVFVVRGFGEGFEIKFPAPRQTGHDDACFVPAGHEGLENAQGIGADFFCHADGGEIGEIHFAFVDGIADPEFVEKAGRIGFGNLFLVSHQSVSCSVTASAGTGAA